MRGLPVSAQGFRFMVGMVSLVSFLSSLIFFFSIESDRGFLEVMKKLFIKLICLYFPFFLQTGCASETRYNDNLKKWVGADKTEIEGQVGLADQIEKDAGGLETLVYSRERSLRTGDSPAINPRVVTRRPLCSLMDLSCIARPLRSPASETPVLEDSSKVYCRTRFHLGDDNKVSKIDFEGNNCRQ